MRGILLTALLTLSLSFLGACSTGGEGGVDVPAYVTGPAPLSETLSVGHVSVGYPGELEGAFVDSSERVYPDGSSCMVTTGQFYNEDWSLVATVEEFTGRSIDVARAEVEDEMSLPDRYEELDSATKAVVDHTEWVSLEDAGDGFVLVKTYDDTVMAVFRYVALGESDHARVMISIPIAWHEANPGFVEAVLGSLAVSEEAAGFPGGVWIPTEADPVYTDEGGVTWGYPYRPEGEPEYVRVDPDMLYAQGEGGVTGYLDMAELEAAMEAVRNAPPDEPGEYDIEVTSNLYGFLSDEVVGVHVSRTFSTQPAETPEESANGWVPVGESVSTTADGRSWGWWTADGSTDMEFVMATDTGRYGYVVASDRIKAENDNWNAFMSGEQDPAVMLDVVLYGTDEVVGRYAVTLYTR